MKRQKICLVSCPGGHLRELNSVIPFIKGFDRYFVTLNRIDTKGLMKREKVFFISDTRRNIFFTVLNFFQSISIFFQNKPDIIITTGAGPALSTCILAWLFNKKVLFIESFTRIKEPSMFGRLVYPFASITFVQWKSLKNYYRKSKYVGPVIPIEYGKNNLKKEKLVFITLGTSNFGFTRLLEKLDSILEHRRLNYQFIAQIGNSKYIPRNFGYVKWLDYESMKKYLTRSEIVITHGGVGSLIDALLSKAKVISVPRRCEFKETTDDHQVELTKELEKKGIIEGVYSIDRLENILLEVIQRDWKPVEFNSNFNDEIKRFLGKLK